MGQERDHGGGLDAAAAVYGGTRDEWQDLSTGINPVPYPIPAVSRAGWTSLPDRAAEKKLLTAARDFWKVPDGAEILAAPGASALIAQVPRLAHAARVWIPAPTYNEHAAAFEIAGWAITAEANAEAQVLVNPNNPDGKVWTPLDLQTPLRIVDESFCDICPTDSLVANAATPGTLVLKSFGKFWGLAGLRLGFAIGDPTLIARLKDMLGPWPVSGVALEVGAAALEDRGWARAARTRLATDAKRLDTLMSQNGAALVGGTSLFRLYRVDDAAAWQARLAGHQIWTRIFPYASDWIRLGLPDPNGWDRLEAAL